MSVELKLVIAKNIAALRTARGMTQIELAEKLRSAFASWYDNGHTNEEDVNTVILRIRMTDGILLHHGTKYDIDFT